jgi:hypothetical protein
MKAKFRDSGVGAGRSIRVANGTSETDTVPVFSVPSGAVGSAEDHSLGRAFNRYKRENGRSAIEAMQGGGSGR